MSSGKRMRSSLPTALLLIRAGMVHAFAMVGAVNAGVSYYVAPDGSDAAPGTLESPFLTIANAVGLAQPGDQVLVREGVYRETIVPPRSGTEQAPITIANYPGERPVVSALDPLQGTWEQHGSNPGIYRIPIPASSVGGAGFDQVFIDGQMAQEARYPNKQSADLLALDAAAIVMDDQYGFTGLDTSGFSAADLAGARFHGRVGMGWAWQSAVVLSHDGTRVQLDSTTATKGWWWPNQFNEPSNPGIGYLAGSLAFLDTGGEWAVSGNDLYIKIPGGGQPTPGQVEMKTRKWCARIDGFNHVIFKGLTFLGGAVQMNGTGLVMEDCEASHLSHFQSLKSGYNANGLAEENGILMSGSGNILRRSIIRDTAGSGVSLTGTNHLITRNLFHHISYGGSYLSPVYLRGSGHTVSFNTIHDAGRYCIKIEGGGHDVSYNEGYRGGRLCKDYGLIGSWNTEAQAQDGKRTRITRNWLYDAENGGLGIYLDNRCRNFIVDHNVTWGLSEGLRANAPGFNNQFFHNTVVGEKIYNTSTYAAGQTESFIGMQVEGINNLLVHPAEVSLAFENFEDRDFRPNAGYHFQDKRNPDTMVRALDPMPFHGSVGFEKPAGTDWPGDPFVENPYIQVQLVPFSDPFFYDESFGQGQAITGFNDGFVGFTPDSGAYEWGPTPWKPGVDGYALSEIPKTYILATFDAQSGTAPNPASKWLANGDAYGSLALTTREGYSFEGWWTESSGGTQVTASTTVDAAGNHTLFARWEIRHPATYTWTNLVDGDATGSWTEQTNWTGGILPTTTDDTADFSTLDLTANSTVSLNGNQEISKLIFADATTASHDWTVAGGSPSTSTLTLDGISPEISVSNRTATISAKLAGSSNWKKTGAGTLLLTNSTNDFSGDITVETGTLEARYVTLGNSTGKTYINSTGSITTGGHLYMNTFGSTASIAESLVIQGTGTPSNGTGTAAVRFASFASGISNMNGSITLDGNANYKIDVYHQPSHWKINGGIARSGSNTGTLFLDLSHWKQTSPVRLTVNSAIDNNGGPVTLLGNTAGILQMDAAGHDLGDFTINGAYTETYQTILKLGISDALATDRNLTLTKGTFDLAGFNQTVNALSGVLNASLITNSGSTASKLTIGNGGGTGTYSGVIADGAAAISLEKTGSGTQTLAGPNSYSGDTTVSGGTLVLQQINTANELATVTIAAGAVLGLDFAGTDTVDKLFLGTPAVQVPAGTYDAAHPTYGGYFSFEGSLDVITGPAASGFANWITGTFANGSVPADQQGPNDDPDGDGISNLMEYAIAGMDPTVPNGSISTLAGKTISFSKRQPLASDITYAIEVSADLGNADSWEVVTPTLNDDSTISYTLPEGPARIFARLKITQP